MNPDVQRSFATDTLRSLLARFPVAAFDDVNFTEAALRDVFENTLARERSLLVAAARAVPPSQFAKADMPAPEPALLARVDGDLAAARWACDAWREALGFTSHPVPTPRPWASIISALLVAAVAIFFGGPKIAAFVWPAPTVAPSDAPAVATDSPSPTATVSPFNIWSLIGSPSPAPLVSSNTEETAGLRERCISDWRKGLWEQAESACASAEAKLPNDPLVFLGHGEAAVANNHLVIAVTPLERAISLESGFVDDDSRKHDYKDLRIAYENRGYAYYELGDATGLTDDFVRAKDDFHLAIENGVTDTTVLYYFANSAYRLHGWCDASNAFKKLLADPQDLDSSLLTAAKAKVESAERQCKA